jgi:predicted RND superfamily exporter protein
MRSGIDTTSRAYQQYQDFMDHFGSEEFILIVLNQGRQAVEPEALKSVQAITRGLEGLDKVTEVSTSAVLFLAFLVLLMSPFRPVVSFGILGAASVLAALLADVIFIPSVILAFPTVRRIVCKEMATAGD